VPERFATNPSMQVKLDAWSAVGNIMAPDTIFDSSQSIARVLLRAHGVVPCLTTTCKHFYVPRSGFCLTRKQCLALQGFVVKNLPVDEFSNSDIAHLAGMAMSMPVVGTLLWAVVCQIDPQEARYDGIHGFHGFGGSPPSLTVAFVVSRQLLRGSCSAG